ncbi:MAG: DNA mismatch repair protein MutS [Proteobacteria bacterium]|nr:DNA mismatch repair protein MutS [Pseudomonadota bacterium]
MNTQKDAKQTPMMQQFYQIKQQHPDKILFYRMGDFYEMFGEDAVTASKVLQIQLTTRNKNKENSVPLCGIPIHAYEQYLNKLTGAGFKVAVCEQTEDPAQAKGLVRREVVRIITPGTVTAQDLLDANVNSFICSIYGDVKKKTLGIAFCDLSTGEFEIDQLEVKNGWGNLLELVYLYQPREILLPDNGSPKEVEFYDEFVRQSRQTVPSASKELHVERLDYFHFDLRNGTRSLLEHFSVSSLAGFGIEGLTAGVCAASAMLYYLKETQKDALSHIIALKRIRKDDKMMLDESTVRNLELFETSDGTSGQHTLVHLLDHCQTAMGSRKLRRWMVSPLLKKETIERRLDGIQTLMEQSAAADEIRSVLEKIGDMERIVARISMPATNITDLVRLRDGLEPLARLENCFACLDTQALSDVVRDFDPLEDLFKLLETHILPDPARKLKEGGFIQPGIDERLDRLKELTKNGKQHIANMEASEKSKTGISSLKIGYNRVFGYYIEVSNASKHLVPDHYIRKQTLVNNERYITEDLKELEESILTAEDESKALELELFEQIKKRLQEEIGRIQTTARIIANIDVLSTFAFNAKMNNYARPDLDDNPNRKTITIKDGRHPVIESLNLDEPFIPNDVLLDSDDRYIMVITGPNMGGKSTFMRQTALIALMAQMGSYVPAQEARLPVFDRIFTRVGASDNLTRGQSTFMVEMSEAASILNNATAHSLIILDEIGRGTSTFDGISIAWSIIEHIHKLGALTLFATHYHELILLGEQLQGVGNAKVVVHEENSKLVFLRKVVAGQTDKSYGIHVAGLAGLPQGVIDRAKELIRELKFAEAQFSRLEAESANPSTGESTVQDNVQMSFLPPEQPWVEELRKADLNNMSPMQSMEFLYRIQKKIG